MKTILAIEATASDCFVALVGPNIRQELKGEGKRAHTQHLLGFVEQILADNNQTPNDVDAIAFAAGPGSFTGVRLAAAIAKSLAYALNINVLPVSSLEALALAYQLQGGDKSIHIMLDARMQEVYYAAFSTQPLKRLKDDSRLALADVSKALPKDALVLTDCEALLAIENPCQGLTFSALAVADLALEQLQYSQGEPALSAQAIYLRDKTAWKNNEQQKQL